MEVGTLFWDYHTNFLLIICKTDSSVLLLGGIGQLPRGKPRGPQGASLAGLWSRKDFQPEESES